MMGRIRGNFVKGLSRNLAQTYPDKFGTDFEENKKVLKEMNLLDEKFSRNKVAGYIVRVASKKKL